MNTQKTSVGKIPRMSRCARRKLLAEGRRSRDPATALRFAVVANLARGDSAQRVAEALNVAPSTVHRTRRAYLEGGGTWALYDLRRFNGHRKMDGGVLDGLRRLLASSPQDHGWARPTWTREVLREQLVRDGYERLSVSTIGRALAAVGARRGRARPIVLCPWSRRRKRRRIRELRALADRGTPMEPTFFVDEVDIHLNPKIGMDWMLQGTQRCIVTPGKNQKRYLAGALNAATGELICVEDTSKNSDIFIKLLWRLATLHRTCRRIHIILDNYGIHSSRRTVDALSELGDRVVLHFLPPYTPEANRIERCWLDLHANVTRNHRCASMDALMSNVWAYLRARNKVGPSRASLAHAA